MKGAAHANRAKGRHLVTLTTEHDVGMGGAFELARLDMADESARIGALRERLRGGLAALPDKLPGIAVSADSACSSGWRCAFSSRR